MLGSSDGGRGGDGAHVGGGGGEVAVGSSGGGNSSIMAGVGDDDKGRGGVGGGGVGDQLFELGERSSGGGNRWPRQETLALLKIRSDMDVIFRDSSLKGPLWDEVSRKMGELGYHRSSKKCKEKFENVYKYHKRTKDGRVGKSDGKTYRFFDQLEALDHHHLHSSPLPPLPPPQQCPPPQPEPAAEDAVPVTMVMPLPAVATTAATTTTTVPSSPHPITVIMNPTNQITPPHHVQPAQVQPPPPPLPMAIHSTQIQIEQTMTSSPSATPSSSSSTSSDEELLGRRKRKRKWKGFFERMMREVIDKQKELQKRFLEAVEKREHDRIVREEAWKSQELSRLNREHEILVQERSMSAAKDSALISFLQKLSDLQHIPLSLPVQIQAQPQPVPNPVPISAPVPIPVLAPTAAPVAGAPAPTPQPQPQPISLPPLPLLPQALPQPQPLTQLPPLQQQTLAMVAAVNNVTIMSANNVEKASNGGSSSRWPKAEVEALINLRSNLDQKYQDNGPKGPLWEEISSAMKKLGYNRNSKRCKEKWENINKYFKKVKESNKKRPQDSKTCPYFHQLDALYRLKNNINNNGNNNNNNPCSYLPPATTGYGPAQITAQPEQQWPRDPGSDSDDADDEEDDDDQGSGYEIVANNNASASMTATSTAG